MGRRGKEKKDGTIFSIRRKEEKAAMSRKLQKEGVKVLEKSISRNCSYLGKNRFTWHCSIHVIIFNFGNTKKSMEEFLPGYRYYHSFLQGYEEFKVKSQVQKDGRTEGKEAFWFQSPDSTSCHKI